MRKKSVPGSGNSTCKGSEAGKHTEIIKNQEGRQTGCSKDSEARLGQGETKADVYFYP